jgi:hypothetical protein
MFESPISEGIDIFSRYDDSNTYDVSKSTAETNILDEFDT